MKPIKHPLPLCLSLLLAACANTPSNRLPAPPRAQQLAPPPVTLQPPSVPTPGVSPTASAEAEREVWDRLRGSFAMPDCDADPAILNWAKYYTHNPQHFESQMSTAMPQLVYVEQIAAKHGVAGEFALLPWVESQYRPVAGRKNRPAGMWQIMPVTAHSMGLRVDGGYDGRLDVPASADAVMAMLRRYHDDLNDWRLVDYAYNAGEFGVQHLVERRGMPPAEPAIPRLPVKAITKEHLSKLLALACVIREPERFNVSLPGLPAEQRLEVVSVDHGMPVAKAADHAGMSVDALMNLNAAYRNGMVDPQASSLLLPHSNAEQFRNAMANPQAAPNDGSLLLAEATPRGPSNVLPAAAQRNADPVTSTDDTDARMTPAVKFHTVGRKDSLWGIARRYSVSVQQLQQWNHLRGQTLKPGQRLKVSAPADRMSASAAKTR